MENAYTVMKSIPGPGGEVCPRGAVVQNPDWGNLGPLIKARYLEPYNGPDLEPDELFQYKADVEAERAESESEENSTKEAMPEPEGAQSDMAVAPTPSPLPKKSKGKKRRAKKGATAQGS